MSPRLKSISFVVLRWLLGALFIFSGAVKCVDPVGTSLYVDKYLAAYGMEFMLPASLTLAVALSVVEFALGVMLVVGYLRRYIAPVVFALVALFSVVTLLSATVLPIGDCGCFGSVIMLSPWMSLLKNLCLLPVAWFVWRGVKDESKVERWHFAILGVAMSLPLVVSLYAAAHLPLVDVSPYREGTALRAAVVAEQSMLVDEGRCVLIFEDMATGEVVESATWLEEGYEYVDARLELPDVETTYGDLAFYDADGVECSGDVLMRGGRVALLCVNDEEAIDDFGRGIAVLRAAYPDEAIVVLSAVGDIDAFAGLTTYAVDALLLRSMIRADVGVVVLNDGVIEFKSHIRDIR